MFLLKIFCLAFASWRKALLLIQVEFFKGSLKREKLKPQRPRVATLCDMVAESRVAQRWIALPGTDGLPSRTGILSLMPVYFWNHLTWLCFPLKTSGSSYFWIQNVPKHARISQFKCLAYELSDMSKLSNPSMSPMCHIEGDITPGCWAKSSPAAHTTSTGIGCRRWKS